MRIAREEISENSIRKVEKKEQHTLKAKNRNGRTQIEEKGKSESVMRK